jgi:small neutral amino acid transporter SnatA (MarC family)
LREEKMAALLVGIGLVVVAILMCLPGIFGWWNDVLTFLKGSIPVLALLIGVVAVFIGIADIKDKQEAKKEEEEEAASTEKSEKGEKEDTEEKKE